MEAEISFLETDISSFRDSFKTQSAKLRNQINFLKTEVSHINSTMWLLEPLQEQVYNSRAPIFQARGAMNIFTEVGHVSTDVELVWLEEEIDGFASALEWKQRFHEIYGIEYDRIAPRIDKTPRLVIEILNFRADFQLLPRYKDTSGVATMLCDTVVMMWWSADGKSAGYLEWCQEKMDELHSRIMHYR